MAATDDLRSQRFYHGSRVFRVEPTGQIEQDPELTDEKSVGHPTMSYRSREPLRVTGEVTEWRLYHGTRADLKPGDLIKPGHTPTVSETPLSSGRVPEM